MCILRLVNIDGADAGAWRWDLAQLQIGSGREWPQPGDQAWKRQAERLGFELRRAGAPVVLAFDGHSLAGAIWPRPGCPVLPCGPFVMPQFRSGPLQRRLLVAWLRACAAAASGARGAPCDDAALAASMGERRLG